MNIIKKQKLLNLIKQYKLLKQNNTNYYLKKIKKIMNNCINELKKTKFIKDNKIKIELYEQKKMSGIGFSFYVKNTNNKLLLNLNKCKWLVYIQQDSHIQITCLAPTIKENIKYQTLFISEQLNLAQNVFKKSQNHFIKYFNKYVQNIDKLILNEIPYSQYEQGDSTQKQFKESFIDFRFQILFKDDKQSYKKFYNRYNSGEPIYAILNGNKLIITDNFIKKTNKGINMAYCLPDNWYKIAKISK